MSKLAAIGIDIGGTQIKAVAVDGEGTVLGRRQIDTSDRGDILLERVNSLLEQLPSSEALGISTPGLVPSDSNKVAWMNGRLECLHGLDWSKQLDRPVYLLNDALAAMAGEAWVGAARGVCDAILMTLGTGVGGAILVDGRVLRGRLGRASHLGHMTVDAHRRGDPEATRIWICKAGDALFEPLVAYLEQLEWRPTGGLVEIVPAHLGHESGAIGAARNAMLGGRA